MEAVKATGLESGRTLRQTLTVNQPPSDDMANVRANYRLGVSPFERRIQMSRQNIGERINAWLAEAPGQTFTRGKWRFWWPAITAFTMLNAGLTAVIFNDGGRLQTYMGAVLVGAGALLVWLCVGFLHYSDGQDRRLARGVSLLDSITLCFVIAHFCGLLWVYGRLHTLQAAETDHKAQVEKYNAEARQVQADNARIADSLRAVAEADAKRARIENDSIYQARKAAEAGVRIQPRQSKAAGASLSTSPVELAKPPEALKDSAAEFLTRWDAWIRLANFGELILAAITLIFIRNRTAKTNAPVEISSPTGDFFPTKVYRSPIAAPAFDSAKNDHTVWSKNDHTAARKKTTRVVSEINEEGLEKLRHTLGLIAAENAPGHFLADAKWERRCVWIRWRRSEHGVARDVASVKARIEILDDAVRMDRTAFRERLEKFLAENGFEI